MRSNTSEPPRKSHGLPVTATWRTGNRSQAWDVLWRRILEDVLLDAQSAADAESGHVRLQGIGRRCIGHQGCDARLEPEEPR
jgi:hypothetical protein